MQETFWLMFRILGLLTLFILLLTILPVMSIIRRVAVAIFWIRKMLHPSNQGQ